MKNRFIVVMIILAMLLVGCGNAGVTNNSQEDISTASKELTIGHNQAFMNFTTHNGGDNGFIWYSENCYETLVYPSGHGVKAGLASSWEEDDDALVLHLREGITFIDGTPFNAEAVKGNLENLQQIQGQAVSFVAALNYLKGIEVVDEYTVKLNYDKYSKVFLKDLASLYPFGMMSLNAFDNGQYSEEVMMGRALGTGPYQMTDHEQGKYYVYEKNPNYWGQAGYYDKVTIKIIPDQESMALALRTGEIDMIFGSYQVNNNMFDEFKVADGFVAQESENINKSHYISLNSGRPPLDDRNVKYAIAHAIDKTSIVKNILRGRGVIAETHFNPDLEYCNVAVESRTFDLEKAKSLLDESGWRLNEATGMRMKDGKPLEIGLGYINGSSAYADMSLAIQSQLKTIGVGVNVEGLDMMTWWGKVMSGDFDMSLNSTIGVPYDPYVDLKSMIDLNVHAVGMAGMEEKAIIDEKINEIYTTNDPEALQMIFNEILTQLNKGGNDIPIYYQKEPVVFNSDRISNIIYSDTVTFLRFDNVLAN